MVGWVGRGAGCDPPPCHVNKENAIFVSATEAIDAFHEDANTLLTYTKRFIPQIVIFIEHSYITLKPIVVLLQSTKIMSQNRFTDELREAAGDQWNRVISHKFTLELAAGTIDRNVLKKYLIQDHRFLDAFVVLLGSIISHARSLEDRIPACQFLALVTSDENNYFERCFEKLGCSAEERASIPDAACTTGFCNLMREVALKGTLAEMLSVITVW